MNDLSNFSAWVPVIIQIAAIVATVFIAFTQLKKQLDNFKEQKIYELQLERITKQLSEFYGPIYMLTKSNREIFNETFKSKIWGRTWKNIIIPNEKEIIRLLKTKIHLLDFEHSNTKEIPPAFNAFFKHTSVTHSIIDKEDADEITFQKILNEYGENYKMYPREFDEEIAKSYMRIMEAYTRILKERALILSPVQPLKAVERVG